MADIVTTKQFVNGQLGVNGDDLNAIIGQAAVNTAFVSAKPVANSPGDNDALLLLQSGGAYAQLLYKNLFNPKWVRPAAGVAQNVTTLNGDTSLWQRGVTFNNSGTGTYSADRYRTFSNFGGSAAVANITQIDLAGSLVGAVTNPRPRYGLRVSCGTAGTIGAGNYFGITQRVELSRARMLFDQPSSLSVWVRTNATGTYTVALNNAGNTQTYKQDFVVGSPNVWTQLTLPNIPALPTASGSWGSNESDHSYQIGIFLACGSTFQSATQSAWQSGQFMGSASTSNFFTANTNTFDICLLQHESGQSVTPFMPDRGGLTETRLKCARYYWNDYPTGTAPGAAANAGQTWWQALTASVLIGPRFCPPIEMRVAPTVNVYSPQNGAIGSVVTTGGVTGGGGNVVAADINTMGFDQLNWSGGSWTPGNYLGFHAELIAEL